MAIYKDGKKVTGVYHNGRTITGVYRGGVKVWSAEAEVLPVYGVELEVASAEEAAMIEYALAYGTVDMTVGGQEVRVAGDMTGCNAAVWSDGLLLCESVALTTAQVAVNAYVEVRMAVEARTVDADEVVYSEQYSYYVQILGWHQAWDVGVWSFEDEYTVPGMRLYCTGHYEPINGFPARSTLAATFNGVELLTVDDVFAGVVASNKGGYYLEYADFEINETEWGKGAIRVEWSPKVRSVWNEYTMGQCYVQLVYPEVAQVIKLRVTRLVQ